MGKSSFPYIRAVVILLLNCSHDLSKSLPIISSCRLAAVYDLCALVVDALTEFTHLAADFSVSISLKLN